MKEIKKEEPKVEKEKVNKEEPEEPTTTDVKCIRRHLNNEYRRAIEVGEVITLSTKYADYLAKIGVVE